MASKLPLYLLCAPRGSIDLSLDVSMLKFALLYGSEVKIDSLNLDMLNTVNKYRIKFLKPDFKLEDVKEFCYFMLRNKMFDAPEHIAMVNLLISNLDQLMDLVQHPAVQTPAGQKKLKNEKRGLVQIMSEMYGILKSSKYAEVEDLIRRNIVTVVDTEFDGNDQLVERYTERLSSIANDPMSFPFFDAQTSNLLAQMLKEDRLRLEHQENRRGKQVHLASAIMSKLPTFEAATLKEVVSIQDQIRKPLVKFRAAVAGYAEKVAYHPWEKGFDFEADELFINTVEPAILEIEEAVHDNRVYANILKSLSSRPIPVITSVSAVLTNNLMLDSHLVNYIALGSGVGLQAIDVYLRTLENKRKIENNNMYFLYRVKERLQ